MVHKPARTLAITSGKGGVGKSNITINLAITLAQQGAKVCIFDADTSLANVNILMGLTPRYNIEHLLTGSKSLNEIMLTGPANISIIPASSGLATQSELDEKQQSRLIKALEELEARFDYILIDTAAGIGNNVTKFLRAAHSILLVISTEPTSLTDAFALLRVLKRDGYNKPPYVLVNMAINYSNGMEVFKRFDGAVRKYLKLSLNYVGYITDDIAVKDSVRHQCPVVLYRPDALATRCFINLKNVLINHLTEVYKPNNFSAYWKSLLTSEPDNINHSNVAKILAKNPGNQESNCQRILNYISASKFSSKDTLLILLSLIKHIKMNQNEYNALTLPENATLLNNLLSELDKLSQANIERNDLESLRVTVKLLSSTGELLGRKLDSLNSELEELLK